MDSYYLQVVHNEDNYDKDVEIENYSNMIYLVTWKTRTHSSGSENSIKKGFHTFKSLLEYLNDRIPKYAIKEWDGDDLYTDNTLSLKAPMPTDEFVKVLLDPERLYNFLMEKDGGIIYEPYSKFAMNIPFEISIEIIDMEI